MCKRFPCVYDGWEPFSAVQAIRSNQCYRLAFRSWETCHPIQNNPLNTVFLTSSQRVWIWKKGTTHDMLLRFSMFTQLPVQQWEMFGLPKRKRGNISSLTSCHEAWNMSSNSSQNPSRHASLNMLCFRCFTNHKERLKNNEVENDLR